jgi:hypothetical protein
MDLWHALCKAYISRSGVLQAGFQSLLPPSALLGGRTSPLSVPILLSARCCPLLRYGHGGTRKSNTSRNVQT